MKYGEVLELLAGAHPDSEFIISDGGEIERVEPGPVLADQTREEGRNGHVALSGGTERTVTGGAVLVDQETGARGAVVLTLGK